MGKFMLWPLCLLSKRQGQDIFPKIYLFWRRRKPLGISTSKCSSVVASVAIVLTCCLCVCDTDKSSSSSSSSSNLSQNNTIGFRHVSAGPAPGEVWAITAAGVVCRRHGVTPDNPAGTGWSHGIGVSDMLVQMHFTYLN